MTEAFLCEGLRTPIGRYGGAWPRCARTTLPPLTGQPITTTPHLEHPCA